MSLLIPTRSNAIDGGILGTEFNCQTLGHALYDGFRCGLDGVMGYALDIVSAILGFKIVGVNRE